MQLAFNYTSLIGCCIAYGDRNERQMVRELPRIKRMGQVGESSYVENIRVGDLRGSDLMQRAE